VGPPASSISSDDLRPANRMLGPRSLSDLARLH
jgi:hypothetical protein